MSDDAFDVPDAEPFAAPPRATGKDGRRNWGIVLPLWAKIALGAVAGAAALGVVGLLGAGLLAYHIPRQLPRDEA